MKFSFELITTKTPEKIWPFYSEVTNWFKWEDNLSAIELKGAFEQGTTGIMTLEGQQPMEFELVEVTGNQSFCDKTEISNLGSLYFNHELIPIEGKTIVRHSVEFASLTGKENKEALAFLSQVFSDVPASVFSLSEVI